MKQKTNTNVTCDFVTAAMDLNIDSVIFAIQHAQAHVLTRDEYNRFGKKYDLQILERANTGWLNVMHLHGDNDYFDLAVKYPVQVVNWHDRKAPPYLAEGQTRFQGAVCSGIRQEETLVLGKNENVIAETRDAINQTDGLRLITGTGCVTPITAPAGNLR
ncbi:MAG: hypothetical protein JXA42_03575, partial [Anaerolineales bacterium]|nr:hypothetical protein [Anaerolineales bacterium]